MLERKSVDVCCVQDTKFRGKWVRMISGKAAEYKLFWIGNDNGSGRSSSFLGQDIGRQSYKLGKWKSDCYQSIDSKNYYFSDLSLCPHSLV